MCVLTMMFGPRSTCETTGLQYFDSGRRYISVIVLNTGLMHTEQDTKLRIVCVPHCTLLVAETVIARAAIV